MEMKECASMSLSRFVPVNVLKRRFYKGD